MDILRLEWFDVPFKVSTSDNHNNIATKSQPVHTYTEFMCWQLTYNVAFYPVKIFDIPYKMLLTIKRFWPLISVLSFTKKISRKWQNTKQRQLHPNAIRIKIWPMCDAAYFWTDPGVVKSSWLQKRQRKLAQQPNLSSVVSLGSLPTSSSLSDDLAPLLPQPIPARKLLSDTILGRSSPRSWTSSTLLETAPPVVVVRVVAHPVVDLGLVVVMVVHAVVDLWLVA